MKPLRVAVVAACPYPWPRGTPIRIRQLALALARLGHEVHVASYHLGEDAATDAPVTVHRIPDVKTYRHTAPGPTPRKFLHLDPLLTRLLRRLHRDHRFDVVHAHHYEGLLIAAAAGGPAPIVYDAHTTLAGELPEYPLGLPRTLARGVGRALDRRLPKLANRTIAVSDAIKDVLLALGSVGEDRIDVIPNGIEWEHFGEARSTPGARSVIFTGNLARYQRVDLLLAAFSELRRRKPDVRLSIVTSSDFSPYEPLARRLGVIDAIELCDAPFSEHPALLARASVAVSPRTDCDGVPQKLLNYMAAGVPIVSFDGSAAHLEHERTGLRVGNGDTAGMASAIERLLDHEDLARRLGDAARERVRRDFSWGAAAERVEEVYAKLLSGAAPPVWTPESAEAKGRGVRTSGGSPSSSSIGRPAK